MNNGTITEEGKYLNRPRPTEPCSHVVNILPAEWSRAVKAVSRLVPTKKQGNPYLSYVEVEYHDDVTFLASTNGHSLIVLELPPIEGLSGYAHLPIGNVKAWLKDKDSPEALLTHDQGATYPDLRQVFPTFRQGHGSGGDLGLSVELLHQVLTAIRDVNPKNSRYQPSAWQMTASAGDRLEVVYFKATGSLGLKDGASPFLIHALLMPLRLE